MTRVSEGDPDPLDPLGRKEQPLWPSYLQRPLSDYFTRLAGVDESLARLRDERDDNYRALAGAESLPEPKRAEARARLQPQVDMSEIAVATLESIKAIHGVAATAVEAAERRAAESATQTESLLTLTKWLVALATLTLVAAIVTLILAG